MCNKQAPYLAIQETGKAIGLLNYVLVVTHLKKAITQFLTVSFWNYWNCCCWKSTELIINSLNADHQQWRIKPKVTWVNVLEEVALIHPCWFKWLQTVSEGVTTLQRCDTCALHTSKNILSAQRRNEVFCKIFTTTLWRHQNIARVELPWLEPGASCPPCSGKKEGPWAAIHCSTWMNFCSQINLVAMLRRRNESHNEQSFSLYPLSTIWNFLTLLSLSLLSHLKVWVIKKQPLKKSYPAS